MKNTNDLNLKFDFSGLSKGRLKTFNMLTEEIDRMDAERQTHELNDDELSFLNAAGDSYSSDTETNGSSIR